VTWLPDRTLDHLQRLSEHPELPGARYRIVRELGRGGMGVVYLAEDTELDREVALKVIAAPAPPPVEQMLREARILAQLEHPGIVPVHDVGELPDGRAFYVMKLVRGRRLDEYVQQTAGAADRLRLFEKICQTVAFAHAQGVVHRDLKPQNIMVGEFGEVLVMDWGVAGVAGGAGRSDPRTDVFALGGLLEWLVTPRPKPLQAVCRKATAADPAARYDGAAALGSDVARYLDGLPVLAYRESIVERAGRWASRNRTAVLLVAAYLVMRALLLFFTGR